MFVVVSCFEVALRNRIDAVMKAHLGNDWLRDLILPAGAWYYDRRIEKTWKHMFSNVQYRLAGRKLMRIFPNKPKSTQNHKFDNTYVFGELDYINKLRNRIAHNEPICFSSNHISVDVYYAQNRYNRIMELFRWMDIDGASLLYGLGRVNSACNQIDALVK